MALHKAVSHGVQWTTVQRAVQQGDDGVEIGRAPESEPMSVEAFPLARARPPRRDAASDPSFARRAITNLFDPPKRLQSLLDR